MPRTDSADRLITAPQVNTTAIAADAFAIGTAAYSAGDLVGSLLQFTGAARRPAAGGVIQTVAVADLAKQDAELDLILFNDNPSNTTFTDGATLDIDDADLDKIAGVLTVSDYADFNDNSVGTLRSAGLAFDLASGTILRGALVTRGTPTYSGTADLSVVLGILQD
jgi:hypothetical protein